MSNEVLTEELFVETPDGALLAVTIRRPKTDARLPCLMTYTPYRVSSGLGGVDLLEFAKHEYVTMIFDVRGTGDSAGSCDSVYSDLERADGLFMIDWASKQSWCDGKVGMWGISYGAIVALQMAALNPPALKAVIARSGSDDPFAEWTNFGGVPRNYMYESYSPFMSARNFAPPSFKRWGAEWLDVWKLRLKANTPWGISFIKNLEDSEFWRNRAARAEIEQITCPVFVVEGWADWYSNPMLKIFSQLKSPRKALIGPWGHQWPNTALPGPRINWEQEVLQWWDHWLKDAKTELTQKDPLTIFVQEPAIPKNFVATAPGWFYTDQDWPIPNSKNLKMYFDSSNLTLTVDIPSGIQDCEIPYSVTAGQYSGKTGGGPFRYNVLRPLDQRLENKNSITFLGQSLDQDQIIIGNAKLNLWLSSNTTVGQISASLVDVFPDGTQALISRHFLNMSYAQYPKAQPADLVPQKSYKIEFELPATAYQMTTGHRIGVKLAAADFQMSWPANGSFNLTLLALPETPSWIELPVVFDPDSKSKYLFDSPPNDIEPELPEVSYEVFEDLVLHEVGYRFQSSSVFGNKGEYRVSTDNPAKAKLSAESQYKCIEDNKEVVITATCVTRSDETTISHDVAISIELNQEMFWQNSWSETVKRRYF